MTVSAKQRCVFHGFLVASLLLLAFAPGFSPAARAQNHLVSPHALQQQLQTQATARQQNVRTLTKFLSTATAQQAMKTAGVSPVQVRNAVPTLSSRQLSSLASRAATAQQQFAAGRLTHGMLLVVIIAIVVVIVVIAIH